MLRRRLAKLLGRAGARWAQAGRWSAAARSYEAAARLNAADPHLHFGLATARRRLGQLETAAEAYEAALARDDRNARWHARLGRMRTRLRQWPAAAAAYEAALARNARPARWHAALGTARAGARQWSAAAEAFEAALARNERPARWHAELGRVRLRLGRWEAAADAYEAATRRNARNPKWPLHAAVARARTGVAGQADVQTAREAQRAALAEQLADDPDATELDHRLLRAHPDRLVPRRLVTRLVADRLEAIRAAAEAGPGAAGGARPRIYVFWAQGIEQAPPVVQRCQAELRRLHAEDDLVILDAAGVQEHVELPEHITRRAGGSWTYLSDVLRLELLARYGGVWLDATCLPREPLLDLIGKRLRRSGFFAFAARRGQAASWLLAAEPGHYMVTMMRAAHAEYWRAYDHLVDYYVFHHIFEALYLVDERFRELWDATRPPPRSQAGRFRRAMLEPYEPARYAELLNRSFVHKLSYKYDAAVLPPDSMLAVLLRDGPPPSVDRAASATSRRGARPS